MAVATRMTESTEQFFARKKKFAAELVDDWIQNETPILVVVQENTANIFGCVLGDEIARESRARHVTPQIYLCHSFETHLIESFQSKHKVIHEPEPLDAPSHSP